MRVMLLAAAGSLAALVAGVGPAQAQEFTSGFSGSHHGGHHRGDLVDSRRFGRDFTCDLRDRSNRDVGNRRGRHGRHDRRDRDRDRFGDCFFGGDFYGGAWAYYNNRSWESDSYNDWWHDQPWRAYPRWVQSNQGCTPDRMWYSGSGWRCSW